MRIMLDSNIHDLIVANPAACDAVKRSIEDGRLKLVSTHVQHDELKRAPEPKRTTLLEIYDLAELRPTNGAVFDVSRWDQCQFGTDEENGSINVLMGGNPKHAEDALIAATASSEADALVTNETRLASKIKRAGFSADVWSWSEFASWLGL